MARFHFKKKKKKEEEERWERFIIFQVIFNSHLDAREGKRQECKNKRGQKQVGKRGRMQMLTALSRFLVASRIGA